MAVELKVNDVVSEIKRGTSSKGDYAFGIVKAEKGSQKITVWFANAEDVTDDTEIVTIKEIESVKVSNKEYPQGSGKWYTNVDVTAKVTPETAGGAKPIQDDPFSEIDMPF